MFGPGYSGCHVGVCQNKQEFEGKRNVLNYDSLKVSGCTVKKRKLPKDTKMTSFPF